ncbi:MAG: PTS sugar transporter subunit IIC, partial [Candidatus Eisenbacteria sp.]|nr:PTS sugar transporter subunit IIC [Candidatus Eisenbacteria bacterium]
MRAHGEVPKPAEPRGRWPAALTPWWPLAASALVLLGVAWLLDLLSPPAGQLLPGTVGAAWGAGTLLLLGGWSLLVSIDERACGPLVLHEPLLAAGVGGLLVGRPAEGLLVGFCVQLVWPGLRPLGGIAQPATGLAAVTAIGWLAWLPGELGVWRFPA